MLGQLRPAQVVGARKNRRLFVERLKAIEHDYPAQEFAHLNVVADNYRTHTAEAVQVWPGHHPRFELVFLPSHGPRA